MMIFNIFNLFKDDEPFADTDNTLEDPDYFNDEREYGPRSDMHEFEDLIKAGIRHKLSDDILALITNLAFIIVNREDKCVSGPLLYDWKQIIGENSKSEYGYMPTDGGRKSRPFISRLSGTYIPDAFSTEPLLFFGV